MDERYAKWSLLVDMCDVYVDRNGALASWATTLLININPSVLLFWRKVLLWLG